MMSQNKYKVAIIPAAGFGTRFSPDTPKQLFKLNDVSIIEKTISAFELCDQIDEIIIPANEAVREQVNLSKHNRKKIMLIPGGDTRAESVYQALKEVTDGEALVIVHDAVRPFISTAEIAKLIDEYEKRNADILVFGIPVYESLKLIDSETLKIKKSVDRNEYYLAQTPQIASAKILSEAYAQSLSDNFFPSDECEAVERYGGRGEFVPGSRKNIKITVPEDLAADKEELIGNGFDSHRFCEGDGLLIGGFKVPYKFSFEAHSDGDIVLHALIDSMLGALNLGDIGTNFPSTEEWRDASGKKLFSIAYEKVRKEGYKLLQFDVIVIAEQPKMSGYREEILRSLSEITSVSEKNIGFKAKTAENMGFIGNNEGAAAMVISRLSR